MSNHESAYDKHWRRLAELLGAEEAARERQRMTNDERADRRRKTLAKFRTQLPVLRRALVEARAQGRWQYADRLTSQINYRERKLAEEEG